MDLILELESANSERGSGFQLKNINLKLEPGAVMGVIGQNGSGKSTMIHMLCGLAPVIGGRVTVCGRDLAADPVGCKKEIGAVFDDDYFRLEFTGIQAADLYGRYYERYSSSKFREYCRRFGVNGKQCIRKLSKGEYIKLQLAFALSHQPRLLLMDEPEAGLDPVFRREWVQILWDLLDEEHSILIATHLTDELERFADYITMLVKGEQAFTLPVMELPDRFSIVRGSSMQIDLLEKDLVGRRHTDSYEEGLYRKDRGPLKLPLTVCRPTLADIMYYISKSEEHKRGNSL